jgi:hypothetical protein
VVGEKADQQEDPGLRRTLALAPVLSAAPRDRVPHLPVLAACCVLTALVLAGLPALAAAAPGHDSDAPVERPALRVAGAVAPEGVLRLRPAEGLTPPVRAQVRMRGAWRPAGEPSASPIGVLRVRAPRREGLLRVRVRGADGTLSQVRRVRVRPLVLAAVGDVNLGDGPGRMIDRLGADHPWKSVGPTLAAADLALANLECAISVRGRPQPKEYVFRGRPSSLRAMRRVGGIDVVNLANNHVGDFGDRALLDTLRHARAAGMTPVGAGATEAAAYRPQVVERLGLRIAFVGFSTVLPYAFRAVGRNPGTAWGHPLRIRAAVRRARRSADVVVVTFHWGIERSRTESANQRLLAGIALDAGATAVIGAHPHVLQPIRRPPGKLVAYSLGNFVFSAASPGTASTGILRVRLTRRGVTGARLLPAVIRGGRPVLRR